MNDSGATDTADLHLHSTCSDGEWTPTRLVRAARQAGLRAIAITDHDSADGLEEACAAGPGEGVEVLPGIEISALEDGVDLHILGYGFDPAFPELVRVLGEAQEARSRRAERIVARLEELGMPIRLENVLELSGGGAVGRPHIAQALVDAGHVRAPREAFELYLGDGMPACVEKYKITARDAIALIHRARGVALVAHPGTYGGVPYVEPLLGVGIDGVEVRHGLHDSTAAAELDAFALDRGLLRSGGSDFHGPRGGAVAVGSVRIPYAWVEEIRKAIRIRQSAAGE